MPTDRDKEAAVDDFLEETSEFSPEAQARLMEYRGRRGTELKLWHNWHQQGRRPEHLVPLIKSLQPLIKSEATKKLQGLGGSIPRAAVENELLNAAVKSMKSYDPERGTSLTTHVQNGFRRFSDFANANRNLKYMPAADMKRYQAYENVVTELHDELGRPPTALEIKERAPDWSEKTIKKMQRGFGRELYTDLGGKDTLSISDSQARLSPRDAFHLTRDRMSEQEQRFGSLYFPPEGESRPPVKNIASALGIPLSRAYQIKTRLDKRVGGVLKKE